jgi:AcrR family transcriptional regulator
MEDFKRARSYHEKEIRRSAILAAAKQLAIEKGPIEIGLNEIARQSGISKPNIYRYFESREDILFSLFLTVMNDFMKGLETELGTERSSIRLVSQCITRQFLQRPLLCQLLGIRSSILENNMSIQAITKGNIEILRLGRRFSAVLLSSLFWLSPENSVWLANAISLYVASLWPASHPSKNAEEVLQKPELNMLSIDAERDLGRFVEVLLTGLKG